jgi:hypothetical protein
MSGQALHVPPCETVEDRGQRRWRLGSEDIILHAPDVPSEQAFRRRPIVATQGAHDRAVLAV